MEKWKQSQIDEALMFGWVIYNDGDKPMVDAECYRCGADFIQESTEDDILPMYCPECMKRR